MKEDEVNPGARVLYVEFRNAYVGDFQSEEAAMDLNRSLEKVEGVEDVNWEDREFFHIFYKEGVSLLELLKRIDEKVTEVSKITEGGK